MTAETGFDYAKLTQEALKGVVRTVLTKVAELERLPGNHHFFISFLTHGPGVAVSKRLREQYPEEMTIVLQHRFYDLQVHPDRFEVKLTFNGIPEKLVVPFDAIRVFVDPSAQFAIPFEVADIKADGKTGENRPRPAIVPAIGEPRKAGALTSVPNVPARQELPGAGEVVEAAPEKPPAAPDKSRKPKLRSVETAATPASADVVDFTTFRKK